MRSMKSSGYGEYSTCVSSSAGHPAGGARVRERGVQLKGRSAGLCVKNRPINENPPGAMGLTNVPVRRIFQFRQRFVNSIEPFLAIRDIRVLQKVFEAADDFAMAVKRMKPDRQIIIGRSIERV